MSAVDIASLNSVLIIRLSSLGDILLTTPMVRSLKSLNPNLKIDFLLRKEFEGIYKNNPHINELITFTRKPNTFDDVIAQIKGRKYDLIIDLQNNLRSFNIRKVLEGEKYRFQKHTVDKLMMVHFKYDRMSSYSQIPVRYAETIPGFTLDDEGLEFFDEDKSRFDSNGLEKEICFAPGAKHFTKMYPVKYWVEVIEKVQSLGYKATILGGESDRALLNEISLLMQNKVSVLVGTLDELAKQINKSSLLVCNDSGLMHLACAVKTPVAVIFGATVKQFGFTPYRNKNTIIENNSLNCRPCSHFGLEKCPKKHFECMLSLKPENVFETINSMLTL